MKDNALIPKHVDEMHPSVHPEREEFGMGDTCNPDDGRHSKK